MLAAARTRDLARMLSAFVSTNSALVLYAYWLHLPASIAIGVRERLGLPTVPVVSRAHRFDIYGEGSRGYLPQREEIISMVDEVAAVSEAGARYLSDRWPAVDGKVIVSRLGAPAALGEMNSDRRALLVRSCSRIVPFKRIPLLIDALAEVQRRGIHVRWEHIGSVDGAYASTVRDLAEERLRSGTFSFLGAMSNTGVREWHADHAATVFVNVSESEGVPVSILEALAQGLPVIATDVGGSTETINTTAGMFPGLLKADPTARDIADRLEDLFTVSDAEYCRFAVASRSYWEHAWADTKNFGSFATRLRQIAEEGRTTNRAHTPGQ
ncbi:glycosyltransferase [Agromyces sp. PvR057]|uniref:glycosyltransferase n=1 Tax=Agromyces sp. PvR057 TaxID=3156403 RepID=UPI0033973162